MKKKVLFLVNHHVVIYNFRLELVERLLEEEYEVYISSPSGEGVEKLRNIGCKIIDTPINRRGINPLSDLKLLFNYIKIIKKEKPNVVLTYTIKPNVYGGLACKITNTPYLSNITGLGTAVTNGGILSIITKFLYKIGIRKSNCVFFQNEENKRVFGDENILSGRSKLIPGSGVNLKKFNYKEYPDNDKVIKCLFVGRVMRDKGITELLEVIEQLHNERSNVIFTIVGSFEEQEFANRIYTMVNSGIVNYIEHSNNVSQLMNESHLIVHPSYHEGLSNVLLEASASGRPVIATNIPGCREILGDGISGFICESKDVKSLKSAIEKFINLPHKEKKIMGILAREKVETEFSREIVVNAYMEEINLILGE